MAFSERVVADVKRDSNAALGLLHRKAVRYLLHGDPIILVTLNRRYTSLS